MRVLLVRNPASGSAADAASADVIEALGAIGEVEILEPRSKDSFGPELRRAVRPEDLVVIAGGDGTLNGAVNALEESHLQDLTFALLPVGTGNDLARALGVPLDPLDAARRLAQSSETTVDLCLASGPGTERRFVNACMGGFPVRVDEEVDEDLKRRAGPLAFWWGGFKAARDLTDYTIVVDGNRTTDVVAVGVGNGRSAGGGIEVFPQADPSDGLLDLCILPAADIRAALRLAMEVRRAEHGELPEVVTRRAERIQIASSPDLAFNVDGERDGLTTPATFEVAGRLRLRA